MRKVILLCVTLVTFSVCLVFVGGNAFAAEPPDEMAFQGRLLDDVGVPIPEGHTEMQFKTFDVVTGGAHSGLKLRPFTSAPTASTPLTSVRLSP